MRAHGERGEDLEENAEEVEGGGRVRGDKREGLRGEEVAGGGEHEEERSLGERD